MNIFSHFTCILFGFKGTIITNLPTRHFYSPYATETTSLHLLPRSSKIGSRLQSSAPLAMDQPLVVMICTFVTILKLISNHSAILETHINLPLVMSVRVNKHTTFSLVSTNSWQQKLKSSTEPFLSYISINQAIALISKNLNNQYVGQW